MVRHSAQRLVAPVCIALLSLAAACRSPILGAPDATGTLTIVLPAASASRPASRAASRAPGGLASLAGTVTRWVLEGAGPGGHSDSWEFDAASMSAAGNTVSLELLVGDWTITVRGYEADGGEAFTATRTVTVARDGENVVQLTLEWAEKALVARFSFDSAIEDDKRRLAATPGNLYSSDPVIAASSDLTEPAVDGLAVAYIADADPEDYGAYIDIAAADGSGLELGQSFALSMWAYPTTESEDSDRVLITSQADPSADSPGFTVSVNAGLVTLSCSDGTATGATTRDGYEYGAWNHIAISIDGESGYASIYVNGAPNAGPLAFSGIPSDPTIRIGARMTNSGFFQGSFDDLRVYAGALAADEIAAIRADGYFSGGRGTAASPYLVATPMDLYNVRRFPAAHFRQTADIDLSASAVTSEWSPISSFTGNYDGSGRSVSNVALG
nr:LamG domain-containing protein [Spirochaetales bacterium]